MAWTRARSLRPDSDRREGALTNISFTEYEHLDLTPPSIPPRSRLFSLEPVGVGTPYVESLTGYITRLAEAHCVGPRRLFIDEIAPLTTGGWLKKIDSSAFANTTCHLSTALNSPNSTSAECVAVLERLTGRSDLRYLTMGYWGDMLSHAGLIRPSRTWCAACYAERAAAGGVIYDQLLWSIRVVQACPRHKLPLCSQCPSCDGRFSWLGPNSLVGRCAKCLQWLGPPSDAPSARRIGITDDGAGIGLWEAEAVGELLAAGQGITLTCAGGRFAANITGLINRLAGGSETRFKKLIRYEGPTIGNWRKGRTVPRLDTLLRLCAAVGSTPLEMLTEEVVITRAATGEPCDSPGQTPAGNTSKPSQFAAGESAWVTNGAKSSPKSWDYASVESSLLDALNEYPPLPVTAVGRRIAESIGRRDASYVRKLFPDLCRALAARYSAYRKKRTAAKKESERQAVRKIVTGLHDSGTYPSDRRVRTALMKNSVKFGPGLNKILRQMREELSLLG